MNTASKVLKVLSVFFGIALLIWGAAGAIFGVTPGGAASSHERLYGLIFILMAILWILPNYRLVRFRYPALAAFAIFGCYAIYSLASLFIDGMPLESNLEIMWDLLMILIPFFPFVSLMLFQKPT